MRIWGRKIRWGFIEDKYLGFNIRKGWYGDKAGYFATKRGKVITLGTLNFKACRSILSEELEKETRAKERSL